MRMIQDNCRRNQQCERILSPLLDLQLKEDDTDQMVYQCFALISKIYHLRRCYLFLFCSHQTRFTLANEWGENEDLVQKGNHHDLDIDCIPWLDEKLKKNEIITISDNKDLSPEITKVREYLGLQGNQTLIVPVNSRTAVEGFLCIDINGYNKLNSEHKKIMHKIAGVIGNTLSNSKRIALLEREKNDAERGAQQKADFVNYISHEIRTPLTSIQSIIEVIEKSNLDNLQTEYVDILKQGVESLFRVVNQALEYSRSECGAIVLQQVPFNLKLAINGCIKVYLEKAHHKGLNLRYRVSENIPEELVGDPGRLCQIIGNLVDNSIKYTREGSIDLQVSLEDENERETVLRFDVIDTGIGIPPEYIGRLFERFSQVNKSASFECIGSGLGLSICKNLVETMGGKILVESFPDKGSKFSFSIKLIKKI